MRLMAHLLLSYQASGQHGGNINILITERIVEGSLNYIERLLFLRAKNI